MNGSSDKKLLLEAEEQHLTPEYAEYIRSRRRALLQNLQHQKGFWECHSLIDMMWKRALDACGSLHDLRLVESLALTMAAHARVRIAMELAFSGSMIESWSLMRDAVEHTAHAHRLKRDPDLAALWRDKEARPKEWNEHFWENKRTRLFLGLEQLHERWGWYSSIGSHANMEAISNSITFHNDGKTANFTYVHVYNWPAEKLLPSLCMMLNDESRMANVFYADWEDRLKFDYKLQEQRADAEFARKHMMDWVITTFQIPERGIVGG